MLPAIGAQRGDVMWLVLREVLALSSSRTVLGVGLLLATSRVLARWLFGVAPWDPLTIAAVAATLATVALAAAWSPAFRASRVDPIEALRCE